MSEAATIKLPGGKRIPRRTAIVLGCSAAGFVLWRYWRAGSNVPAAATEDTTAAGITDLAGATADGGSGVAGGSTVGDAMPWSSFGTSYRDPATVTPTTNQGWYERALNWAVAVGYDPQTAAEGLGRYLANQGTAADRSMLTAVLGFAGTPPEGSYGYPVATPITSTPPTAGQPVVTTPTPTPAVPVVTLPTKITTPVAAAKPTGTVKNYGWFSTNSVKNTLGTIAQRYGTTVAALKTWNPNLGKYGVNTNLPVNTPVKVRSTATPTYVK